MEHKKYWIKLEKDFLNSSQIKVIKNMPNGKDYIIFYLALMLESTNTEGHLRFNELVPYNEEMLASITDTNVDIVRSAMKIFQSLGMIQILENGTIFLPDVPKRVGKECESAERVRLFREREQQKMLQCNSDVTKCNDNKDKDKDKDKEEDKDKDKYKDITAKQSLSSPADIKHKYGEYKNVLLKDSELESLKKDFNNFEELIKYLDEYIEMKGYKAKSHYLAIRKWVVDAVKEQNERHNRKSKKKDDDWIESLNKTNEIIMSQDLDEDF